MQRPKKIPLCLKSGQRGIARFVGRRLSGVPNLAAIGHARAMRLRNPQALQRDCLPIIYWSIWSTCGKSAGGAMPETVNLYEAKTNLSRLVDRAAAGEEIVIAKAGKPKAKLVPYQPPRKKRRLGQNLLGITYIADDFDEPLPPELQKYFE